jgi:hypothetical protein
MAVPIAAIMGGAQLAGGAIQAIAGGGQAKRAQRKLERMIDNYQPSQSIMDFYTKAMNKYNANPTQSALYRSAMGDAQQGLTTGINSLQDRRSALAGTANLVQGYNNTALRANAAAEAQQGQDLATLGGATQLKDREDKYKFEAKYNLLSQKAGAGNQIMNAGLSNAFGGMGNIADYYSYKQMYGGGGGRGNNNGNYIDNRS